MKFYETTDKMATEKEHEHLVRLVHMAKESNAAEMSVNATMEGGSPAYVVSVAHVPGWFGGVWVAHIQRFSMKDAAQNGTGAWLSTKKPRGWGRRTGKASDVVSAGVTMDLESKSVTGGHMTERGA